MLANLTKGLNRIPLRSSIYSQADKEEIAKKTYTPKALKHSNSGNGPKLSPLKFNN